jgi:hypothetical protein
MPPIFDRSFAAVFAIIALLAASPATTFGQNPELRYQAAAGQQFAYDIEITIDSPTKVTTLKGLARYTVNSANADQLNLTYRGGLNESSKGKATGGGGRGPFGPGFGPFGPGFRGPPDPFSRPAFAGKVQTTNRITLNTRGGVVAMEGDSQLPYLLGNVSLLPFEVLPPGNERQWKYDTGISIETKNENTDRFGPFGRAGRFGPFGPFGQEEDKKSQSGEEAADYSIQSQDDQKVSIKKTYRLKTPPVREEPGLEITGEGTWVFNRKDQLPESMDFKQKLLISEPNTQTTVPISISYRRLSAEAIAKMDQEAQQRLKEMEQKAAAEKQKAEAPLTPDEKRNALTSLSSGDSKKIGEALAFLRGKSLKEPDSEVAAAIETLLAHQNPKTKEDAKATLRKWSPEFNRKLKLNEAYAERSPVESTDREVNSLTPLYVGQIIQFQDHGSFWYAGEVLELLSDGKVRIRGRGFGARESTVARRNIQLAPDEVDQPHKPPTASPTTATSTSAATGSTRTWTDASGEHKIEATYLGVADGKVKLKKSDGKEIAVPLDKLSADDQKLVEKLQAAKKSPNPFE